MSLQRRIQHSPNIKFEKKFSYFSWLESLFRRICKICKFISRCCFWSRNSLYNSSYNNSSWSLGNRLILLNFSGRARIFLDWVKARSTWPLLNLLLFHFLANKVAIFRYEISWFSFRNFMISLRWPTFKINFSSTCLGIIQKWKIEI